MYVHVNIVVKNVIIDKHKDTPIPTILTIFSPLIDPLDDSLVLLACIYLPHNKYKNKYTKPQLQIEQDARNGTYVTGEPGESLIIFELELGITLKVYEEIIKL